MSNSGEQQTKQPYTKPKLTVYGDVRKITENVGVHGAFDKNPTPGHFKTLT